MTAYYNEIDRNAAAWLRELIRRGLIAPGDVDERSIEDVSPDDLSGYTQCHFFAGIGVWSYALRQAGWPDDRPVWTGSCPCPPFSSAGKRQRCPECGSARNLCHPRKTGHFICLDCGCDRHADGRHLWPEFSRLIRECRPPVVFGEQVASADGRLWLDVVSADLQNASYGFAGADLCAAGFGAPHIRQRLYWVAYADDAGPQRRPFPAERTGERLAGPSGVAGGLDNAPSTRHEWSIEEPESSSRDEARVCLLGEGCGASGLAHADGGQSGQAGAIQSSREHRQQSQDGCSSGGLADADCGQCDREPVFRGAFCDGTDAGRAQSGGEPESYGDIFGLADSASAGQQWGRSGETGNGCDKARVESERLRNVGERPGPTNGFWRDADWLFCRDGKWRPVEPGTFPLAHGAPARVGRLRGYGNAIVAPAAQAFIEAYIATKQEQ